MKFCIIGASLGLLGLFAYLFLGKGETTTGIPSSDRRSVTKSEVSVVTAHVKLNTKTETATEQTDRSQSVQLSATRDGVMHAIAPVLDKIRAGEKQSSKVVHNSLDSKGVQQIGLSFDGPSSSEAIEFSHEAEALVKSAFNDQNQGEAQELADSILSEYLDPFYRKQGLYYGALSKMPNGSMSFLWIKNSSGKCFMDEAGIFGVTSGNGHLTTLSEAATKSRFSHLIEIADETDTGASQ